MSMSNYQFAIRVAQAIKNTNFSHPFPTSHNLADSVPTSNRVCIKEVTIRTTFSHMINISRIIYYTCSIVIDIQIT